VRRALLLVVMGVEMSSDKAKRKNMGADRVEFDLSISKRALGAFVAMCVGGVVLTVGVSFADNLRTTQTVVGSALVIPYDGYLMLDSSPITGTQEIKFTLYESAVGGTMQWTETQTVTLYNGRFSVGLGSSTVLTDTLLDAEQLWLEMAIVDSRSGSPVEVTLSGRQAIEAAPFATWAANSADWQVAGSIDVDANAEIAGTLTVNGGSVLLGGDNDGATAALQVGRADGAGGRILFDDDEIDNTVGNMGINRNSGNNVQMGSGGLTVDGNVISEVGARVDGNFSTRGGVTLGNDAADTTTISGSLTTTEDMFAGGALLPKYRNWNGVTGDGGAAILNDNNGFKAFMIVGNESAINGNGTAGERRVNLYDDVTISGDLEVNGAFANFALSREYDAEQDGTGTDTEDMVSSTNSFCFLTTRFTKGQDNDNHAAHCYITDTGTVWRLNAGVVSGDGDDALCRARCFSW